MWSRDLEDTGLRQDATWTFSTTAGSRSCSVSVLRRSFPSRWDGWRPRSRRDDLADDLLPLFGTDGPDGWVAHGYAAGRIEAHGLDRFVRQLQRRPDGESTPQQAGLLLAVTRPTEILIKIVDELHSGCACALLAADELHGVRPDARLVVARKLMEYRRPRGAINLLVTMLHVTGTTVRAPDVDLGESALLGAATGPSDDAPAPPHSRSASCLTTWNATARTSRPARLEFFYSRLLQHTRPARTLSEVLRTDPALFAEILTWA